MFGTIFYNNYFDLVRSYITLVTFYKINSYNKGINRMEHTFSTLHQLKNHLQSTMTQERLNHVMLLHIHKDRIDNINLLEIAK